MRPARGDYPCSLCGLELHSPGALGGHTTWCRRAQSETAEHGATRTPDDGSIGPADSTEVAS